MIEELYINRTTEEAIDTTTPQAQENITAEADQERNDRDDNQQAQKIAVTRKSRANTSPRKVISHRPTPDTLLKVRGSTKRKPRRANINEIDLKMIPCYFNTLIWKVINV